MKQTRGWGMAALLASLLATGSGWASSGGGSHWGYQGTDGPEHWGDLGYETCRSGLNQSPINLGATAQAPLEPLVFAQTPTSARVINNGHTIQVNFSPGNTLTVGGKSYELLQFHFHAKSEHAVKGRSFPMELHLVHKSADNRLAVVGVILREGAEHPALEPVFTGMSAAPGQEVALPTPMDPSALLPKNREYFHYMGSLTTPPCSEGVAWFVLKEPMEVSASQVARFTALYANNARPIQPLHGRTLLNAGDGAHASQAH